MTHLYKNYRWIPTLYLLQGLPFTLVIAVTPIFYKNFAIDNRLISLYTSLLGLPWVLKFLVAPLLETLASKRSLTLTLQLCMSVVALLLALSLFMSSWFYLSLCLFFLLATISALHDTCSDGLYIDVLDITAQAYFVGIRILFYQIGKLICLGLLVYYVGHWLIPLGKQYAWQLGFLILTLLLSSIYIYHQMVLPAPLSTQHKTQKNIFGSVIDELLQLPHLACIVIFTITYTLPEAFFLKIAPLFLMDNSTHGGMAFSLQSIGIVYGEFGTAFMLLGATLAGLLLKHYSLQRCLIPFTILTTIGNAGYWYLSLHPQIELVNMFFIIALREFLFGMSNAAYMLYILQFFARGHYSMSLYAMGTALMSFAMMAGGAPSGYLQTWLGYSYFFALTTLISIVLIGVSIFNVRRLFGNA